MAAVTIFKSLRPRSSTGISHTPEGLFTIQDAATGRFIITPSNGGLVARFKEKSLALKLALTFIPGGGTIQLLTSKRYVNAPKFGNTTIVANRLKASDDEIFRWAKQTDGTFVLTAIVNRQQVSTTAENGALLHNAGPLSTDKKSPSTYRLTETRETSDKVPPPARGVLQSVQTGNFVATTTKDSTLRTTGKTKVEGTAFIFEKVPEAPYYTIKGEASQKYVTGDPEGKNTLKASAGNAKAWEQFQIVRRENQSSFLIVHVASGYLAALQSDGTIIAKSSNLNDSTLWNILP